MRTITVLNPQTQNTVSINTEVTTWAELQDVLMSHNINSTGMKGIVRETRNSLESGQAVLPETNFTLFLSASKMAAGFIN